MFAFYFSFVLGLAHATTPTGPADILPPMPQIDIDAQREEQESLNRSMELFCQEADSIIMGEVLNVHTLPNGDIIASILVENRLKGEADALTDVRMRPYMGYQNGRPELVKPTVIPGYKMLAFLNTENKLVDGEALFLVEAGHVWRNKRPDVFLNPRTHRDWSELTDPREDYVIYSLNEVATVASRY